jgi:hypothetical protein
MKSMSTLYLTSAIALNLSLGSHVQAAWVKIGENARSVAYIDSQVRRSGETATYWVLFDYKAIQESQRSGRRYRSEKSQHETRCNAEQDRILFFTWHEDPMGDGVVVYTGRNSTPWEPTNAPNSYANAMWRFACSK